ncbi:fimbria/pilus periplasmic chaperone, partial [Escherichia coli]|nr:fimbria/pilus periplasmic chaperone [Escherichia coli]
MIISPLAYSKGVGLNATRIIYPEGENSVGVIVRNEEPKVNYLVQAYISSDENPVVFQVTPPLFRIN